MAMHKMLRPVAKHRRKLWAYDQSMVSTPIPPPPVAKSAFLGWRVVAGAFFLAVFGWGIGFYGPPIYLATVVATRGWSVALVSGAVTLHFLIGAAVVANLPRLHRRFGIAGVTRSGAVALALGLSGWALAASPGNSSAQRSSQVRGG